MCDFFSSMRANDWVTAILSLSAIIISLIPYCRKTKIYGKLIGIRVLPNGRSNVQCIQYLGNIYIIQMCLYCANKNLSLNGIEVRVRYHNGWKKAVVYYPQIITFNNEKGIPVKMRIPPEEYLPFNGVIPIDTNNKYYIHFTVPGTNLDTEFEELELTIRSYTGHKKILTFNKEDIDFNNMLVEEEFLVKE